MYEQIDQIESDLIGRIAQLQYLNKSGSFQLSLRQRNTGGDSFNLFENVNAILKVDLNGYAAGRSVLPADLQHRYKLFERGVICTRLFSKNKNDIAVAQSIIASLVKDQPDHPAGTRSQGLPVEFRFASWLNLFDAFQLSSAPRDSDNLTMHDGRKIFRILQEQERANPGDGPRLVALLNFIARRVTGRERKELILDMVDLPRNEPELYRHVINFNLMKKIYVKEQASGLLKFLQSVVCINKFWPRDGFGQLFTHLGHCSKNLAFFQQVLEYLRDMARHEGIAPQVVDLLLRCQSAGDISEVLRYFRCGTKTASIDAQRLCGTILKSYKIADPDALRRFCDDVSVIGLDAPIINQLISAIKSDAELVERLVMGQLEASEIIASFEQADSLTEKFYLLTLLALRNFRGHHLGFISKGISTLHKLKRTANIDKHHFDAIFADITQELPDSLSRLDVYPEGIDENLVCLYTALYIASEQLHSTEMTNYFSDSFYGMSWFEKGTKMSTAV